ncbi:MAG: hypothetical protein JSW54_02165, partial [Fidelibacterota bacterium]
MRLLPYAILISLIVVPVSAQLGDVDNIEQSESPRGLFFSFHNKSPFASTKIGVRNGPLALFGGLDLIRIGLTMDDDYTSYATDYVTGRTYKDYESEDHVEFTGVFFIPHAGLKYFLRESPLSLYVTGDIFFILPSIKGASEGREVEYNPDGSVYWIDDWDYSLETDEEEMIE